jgi:hypothetical protein
LRILIAPELRILADVDKFRANDEGVAAARHPSRDHGAHIELASDFLWGVGLSLVTENRVSRHYAQLGDAGKIVDQSFRDAITEVFRVLVTAGIRKWQHRNRVN